MNCPDAISLLISRFSGEARELPAFRDELGVSLSRERILEACRILKAECGFDMLTDLSGVDNQGRLPRFEVHYLLYSLSSHARLRLTIRVPEEDLSVDSVTAVWPTADWHEREAYDMFGLTFKGHPDLRRILMWDGYPYYPLRKDFPVAGLPADLPSTAVNAGMAETAPMEGGPFVAGIGNLSSTRREPRACETAAQRDRSVREPDHREEI